MMIVSADLPDACAGMPNFSVEPRNHAADASNGDLMVMYRELMKALDYFATMDVDISWEDSKAEEDIQERIEVNRNFVKALDNALSIYASPEMVEFSDIVRDKISVAHKERLVERLLDALENLQRVADAYAVLLTGIDQERAERSKFEPTYHDSDDESSTGSVPFEL